VVRFGVLGPVQARADGELVVLAPKPRTLLSTYVSALRQSLRLSQQEQRELPRLVTLGGG
jgi:hypothetical protein